MTIHDDVGAYALHALPDDERAAFETHLAQCEKCRAELVSLSSVLEALGDDDGDLAGVPDGLVGRLAAELAVTEQDRAPAGVPVLPAAVNNVPVAPTGEVDDAASSMDRKPGRAAGPARGRAAGRKPGPGTAVPLRRRATLPRLLAAAAAVIGIAALGVGLLSFRASNETAAQVNEIRKAPDAVELALGLGDAKLYVSRSVGGVAVTGVTPGLPRGETYQIWVVPADGSAPIPGPTLGDKKINDAWLTSLDGAAAIAISVEPDGGSTTPTKVVTAVTL